MNDKIHPTCYINIIRTMATVMLPLNRKLWGLVQTSASRLNICFRTMATLKSDSTNIYNHPLAAFNLSTIAKNIDNSPKNFSIDILDYKGLLQKDSVALSAYYYSNCHEVREKFRYTEPVIKSTLKPLIDMNIELPKEHKDYSRIDMPMHHSHRKEIFNIIPVPSVKIIEDPFLHRISPIEEAPSRIGNIEKIAKRQSRMLKIRKKKMKVHRRKRLWKRMWSVWKKKFFNREKRREIEFRQKLIDKVNAAEKFNAEAYVDDYLEDLKYELIPKTYKHRKKPVWLIKELLERDTMVEGRKRANNTDMLTGEPLIKNGETVEEFVGRYWK